MHALIMAGGAGSRLNLGEKPLCLLAGQPMIGYVALAFRRAGCEPIVAVSPMTPMTLNWCRASGIEYCRTGGNGYVDDMIEAVHLIGEEAPLFISVSDIPCVTAEVIQRISASYERGGRDALSAWVPASLVSDEQGGMPFRECIGGIMACPAGINILRGDLIDEVQDEQQLLLDEPCLALNVNTRLDLAGAEAFLRRHSSS
jgi:adenosylcobinamide-phosphate guanylyltransferase